MPAYEEVMTLGEKELSEELDSCETELKRGIIYGWVGQAESAEQEIEWIRSRAHQIGAVLRYRNIDGEIFCGVGKLYFDEPYPWSEYDMGESFEWDGEMPIVQVEICEGKGYEFRAYAVGPNFKDGREFIGGKNGFHSYDDAEDAAWDLADSKFGADGWYQG